MAFLFYFDDMKYVISNGKLVEEEKVFISPNDHSYRYGDGLFETMKVADGNILLKQYHFKRLFSGLQTLKIIKPSSFSEKVIEHAIKELCIKNKCGKLARARLSVSRGNGGLYDCDNKFSYLIECWPLEKTEFNEHGLVIDIFPDVRKSLDTFSNLKSANYLPYVMAAVWARENKLNDALILNSNERICDATIANIFWVKDKKIFTPPLAEGCVDGIMRRRILDLGVGVLHFEIEESPLDGSILFEADEIFLTNVITVRWVGQVRNKKYSSHISRQLFDKIVQTISD